MNEAKSNRFIVKGGTVTDTTTDLMWQQESAGPMTWEEAIKYCEDLRLGGYNDWRLPSDVELISLRDSSRFSPAIDTHYFPNTQSSYYWSSTTDAQYTYDAWCVYFGYGGVHLGFKAGSGCVRAVRGGQAGALDEAAISG